MYLEYWKLRERPFEEMAASTYYYPSDVHQGALLKLRYAVENRRAAALLAGASGMGKSLLVESLLEGLPAEFTPRVQIVFPDMPADQLIAWVANELTGEVHEDLPTVEQSVRRIRHALQQNVESQRHAVLVIDEAHLLTDPGRLETLRLVLNFTTPAGPALTLILVGQPQILPALDRASALEERLAIKSLLRPFSEEESFGYVQHRLQAAGADASIFETSALETIHQLSRGVPRALNRLADLCLLVGYADELPRIGKHQVEAVAEDLLYVE